MVTDRMPTELCKLHDKYQSPVIRIGPNDLHFNHPDTVAAIYKSGWLKGDFYEGFGGARKGLFSVRDDQVGMYALACGQC